MFSGRGNFFLFFSETPLRGVWGFDILCTRSPPPRGASRSLKRHGAKSADPKEDPPRRGSAGRDAEHEIVDARAGSGREAGAKRDERFFSESLILAQNERW